MAEKKKADIAPGDRVMIAERRGGTYPATVIGVARVWCELRRDAFTDVVRFRLDDRTDGSKYGAPSRFYTMDEWAKRERERENAHYLSSQAVRLDHFAETPWTTSTLAAALRAMSDVPGLLKLIEDYGYECSVDGVPADAEEILSEIKKRLGVTE